MGQLLRYSELTEEQLDYLDNIDISANNLLTIINDILDLSKIEAGKVELEQTDFSLQVVLHEVARSLEAVLKQRGIDFQRHLSSNLPEMVVGDPLRVKQILLNLLSNAVKFTRQGTITVNVECTEQTLALIVVHLSVQDTGIGISQEALQSIFEPFSQAECSTTRKFGGTGLGLTICRHLAAMMGGRIWAESSEGVGSTFHVELVLGRSKALPVQKMVKLTTEKPIWTGKPLHVLVAEDNRINALTIVKLMQNMGHTTEIVGDGTLVLERWRSAQFDLILMDIQMPVLGGDETVKQIRQEEAHDGRHIPVIALTAYALPADKERFMLAGFDGYVVKPIIIEQLMQEMMKVLN